MGTIGKSYHAGPDDPIYKGGLRVSSVLGPSALSKSSQPSTAGASSDPMLPAMDGLEAALRENLAKNYKATEQLPQAPSESREPD